MTRCSIIAEMLYRDLDIVIHLKNIMTCNICLIWMRHTVISCLLGGISPSFPFRPDAPEPEGFHDDSSLYDLDNDLFVVPDQAGTDLAQRGLCAAEVRVKTKQATKKVQKDPLEILSRAAPKRPHEVWVNFYSKLFI